VLVGSSDFLFIKRLKYGLVGPSDFLFIKRLKYGLLAIENINFSSSNAFEISGEIYLALWMP
jgi:hypothetical protein